MLAKHTNCIYPVEYRFVGGDSGMLSPYYERASATISVSGGPGIGYWDYLLDVDTILRQYGRDRIGASFISIALTICRYSIRDSMTSKRSGVRGIRQAAS
jgi:hypothetical protein